MSKKHGHLDDVLADLDTPMEQGRAGARFLSRQTRVSDRLSGEVEEKTLRWIDPAQARMWARHNRAYDLLTEDNCRDLIDGIRSQGKQEFPAIVRRTGDAETPYEVIAGARRHFAVSWLRANNYPNFRYLIEVRDLTDEEAFRLADIENRDREDISDYERARDYLAALDAYYGGSQKEMAARLEVSPAWLSRYLQLARLPSEVVGAFASIRDLRELHARTLKPHLGRPSEAAAILEEARGLAGQGLDAAQVMARLKAVVAKPKAKTRPERIYRRAREESGVKERRKGRITTLEFEDSMSRTALQAAFEMYLKARFDG
ncbi:chromosome partitioning protein, ParB family [Jannaschia faecimaris]|uniref:Chromosome partitioning protein, ParB family n=1 Tax=Jannaschia faecimaris TaxID=1244108 RepID=A0A1H3U5W8_9RHOB|nr:ParB/RepB/Spo0J family partition protein [Jannaschia faecimaris]SDZ57772.1 chromosome partitioning protein, ParB family [Jannaschia faecimaris]